MLDIPTVPVPRGPKRTPRPSARLEDVTAHAVSLRGASVAAGGRTILGPLELDLPVGGVTAIAGGSGAGKSTLLAVMAGLRGLTGGQVVRRRDLGGPEGGAIVGFVPQDDIIHGELPLHRTLVHAARLRLPSADRAQIEVAVTDVLMTLGLAHRRGVRVDALSGGQRKRASIAVELLARPGLLLLDEPTSGLDPVRATEVVVALRRLADEGITVIMTTHDPAQIDGCDHVLFLASNGRVAYAGRPDEALAFFDVERSADVYQRLADDAEPDRWPRRFERASGARTPAVVLAEDVTDRSPGVSHYWPTRRHAAQVRTLVQRNAEVILRNRLTLAVMIGCPALVIAMMAVLFPSGAGDLGAAGGADGAPVFFWIAFAGFFFGLTYGLLQVVGERAVYERERFAGLSPFAYLLSKVLVLVPVLAGVALALLVVLRLLDRLPGAGADVYGLLLATIVLESLAALLLGLAASAAVADAAQATLALPLLCFPQVLFAGAVVATSDMALAGRVISVGMVNRWAYESLGRVLASSGEAPRGGTPVAFDGSWTSGWAALVVLAGVAGALAWSLLRRSR